ncbi:MAG TPA: hypothetical protein VHA73_09785 [Acidimicrobiales bacterium]|jgi:hypothetical protein|nr:hypothetical protein [Acidimicrobiales bacterium]
MAHLHLLAGLTWDPGLRAIVLLAVAVGVLMGSTYILLTTNVGHRLGFLLGLSAVAGVLTALSIVWMLYGLGYKGRAPEWKVKEVTVGSPAQASISAVRTLPLPSKLPSPDELIDKYHLESAFATQQRFVNLSDISGASAQARAELQKQTGGWRLLPTADKNASDASATATQYLTTESTAPKFTDTNQFVVLGTYDKGGKPGIGTSTSIVHRVLHRVETTAMWFIGSNPTHYAVVQVRPAVHQVAQPGEAPPTGVPDATQPVYNIVMVRDLGSVRQPSFAIFLFSAILLAICLTTLHRRDKVAMALRAAPRPETAGV